MNNQWYINSSGKYKGPYSAQDLQLMLEEKQITKFTLCFNRSLGKWIPFFDAQKLFFEAQSKELVETKLPPLPNLPTLPVEQDAPPAIKFNPPTPELEPVQFEIKAPAPVKRQGSKKSKLSNLSTPIAETKKFPTHIIALSSVVILLCFFASFILFSPSTSKEREIVFKNISIDVLKELQNIKDHAKFYVKFGLDKNSEIVYGRSNLAASAEVSAVFKRVNHDKVEDQITFSSSAILKDGNIVFNDLEFREGEKIIEGEYEVKLKASVSSFTARLKNYLLGRSNEIIFEEKTYLLPSSLEAYKTSVASFNASKKLYEKEILVGLDQKLQTIDSILTSMALHFRLSINKNRGSESASEFESRYTSSAGPLLQSIILEDYEKLLSKSEQKVQIRKISGDVHSTAIDVSALSAKLSTDLRKLGRITPQMRMAQRDELSSLTATHKEKIQKIREEISSMLEDIKSQ